MPSQWGEDAGHPLPSEEAGRLPDRVLESSPGEKVNSESPCVPSSHPERRIEREKERKGKMNDTGRPSFGEQGP